MEPAVDAPSAKVYDADWDVDGEYGGVTDWEVSAAGYLVLRTESGKPIALYAPGTWTKVEFTQPE